MNRRERELDRSRRSLAWSLLFLVASFYWIKCLYEEIDSMKFDKSITQLSTNDKDSLIINLNKKIDSLKLELTKPIEVVVPLPKPKRLKKVDTTHVDTARIILPVVKLDSIK